MKKDISKIKESNLAGYEKEFTLRQNLLESDLFTLESSRNEYIMSLDPLIKKYASKFVAKGTGLLTFDDYVNEAYVRVLEKFDKFKFKTSDNRLSTFMTTQIIDAMQTLKSKNEQAYCCTTSNVKMITPIKEYIRNNPDEDYASVAKHFNISKSRLLGILDGEKRSVSIHKPNSDDEKNTLLDSIESRTRTAEEMYFLKHSSNELKKLLSSVLSAEEFNVIEDVFGLNEKQAKILQEIADTKNCSKENVRQIKVRAFNKIKASSVCEDIRNLLNQICRLKTA